MHNPAKPESTAGLVGRAICVIAMVVVGMAAILFTGCASTIQQGTPVFVSVTEGTEANPEPQLAVEWPATIRRREEIVTIQIDGRVISYAPLTEDEAAKIREALRQ